MNGKLGIVSVKKFRFYKGEYFTYGGFGTYILNKMKTWDDIVLFVRCENAKPLQGWYKIEGENLEIYQLPMTRGEFQVIRTLPRTYYLLRKYLKTIDLVECRVPDYTGLLAVVIARIVRKPLYVVVIDDWKTQAKNVSGAYKYGLGWFLKIYLYSYDFFERLLLRRHVIFAQGTSCYEKHKGHAKFIKMVFSSTLSQSDFNSSLQVTDFASSLQFITIGRLSRVKNIEHIINSFRTYTQDGRNAKLYIVGEGGLKSELESLVESLGLSDVIEFTGQLNRQELRNLLFESDVLLHSSLNEGTPKVILEAFAARTLVIASGINGIPDLVKNGITGYTHNPNRKHELLERMNDISNLNALSSIIDRAQEEAINYKLEKTIEEMNVLVKQNVSW